MHVCEREKKKLVCVSVSVCMCVGERERERERERGKNILGKLEGKLCIGETRERAKFIFGSCPRPMHWQRGGGGAEGRGCYVIDDILRRLKKQA